MPCSPARSALWGIIFSFPPTLHVGHRLPRHMQTLWGLAPIGWSWNLSAGNEGYAFRPGSTAFPVRMQMSSGFLKRRISPGCILLQPPHTGPCQPKAGVWLPLIVWLLKPSVWAAPECLHCPDLLPEPRSLCSGPRALSLGIRVIT